MVGQHPLNSLQPCAVQTQGIGVNFPKIISEGHALEIRASLHEIRANTAADGYLPDTREVGAFAFERVHNGLRSSRAQQLQRPQIGQSDQDVDELSHQILWGIIKRQVHGQNPGELRFVSSIRTDVGLDLPDMGGDRRVRQEIGALSVQTV